VIYQKAISLVELFRLKSRVANGRPWKAGEDLNNAALDAVMSFVFGDRFQHSATAAAVEAAVNEIANQSIRTTKSVEEVVEFPTPRIHASLQAIYDLGEVVSSCASHTISHLSLSSIE
jgi:hypothetical protein